MSLRLKLLLFLLLFFEFGQAQLLSPNFRHFTNVDGLPSTEVYQVLNDEKGYLWFATDAGVVRFDGSSFRIFTILDSLPENSTLKMFKDYKGRIWFNALSGKLSYYENGKITPYKFNYLIEKNLHFPIYSGFYVDSQDWVYLSVNEYGGSNYYITKTGLIKKRSLSGDVLTYDIIQIDSSTVYSTFRTFPANLFPTKINFYGSDKKLSVTIPKTITSPRLGSLLLHNGRVGFFCGTDLVVLVDSSYKLKTLPFTIISAFEDEEKNIWVGTYQGGVYKLSANLEILSRYFENISISSTGQDIYGGYWFTSLESGVYYLPDFNINTIQIIPGLDKKVNSISILPDSSLLYGSSDALIYRNNFSNAISIHDLKKELSNKIYAVTSTFTSWNRIAIGGIAKSNYLDDLKIFKLDEYSAVATPAMSNFIISKDSNLVFAGYDKIYSYDSKRLMVLNKQHFRASVIAFDYQDRLLAGTITGLYYLHDSLLFPYPNPDPLFKSRITDIKIVGKNMYLGTREKGIAIVRPDSITIINSAIGLTSNNVRKIIVEGNIIWAATNRGIDRIQIAKNDEHIITQITSKDGLVADEVNDICKQGNKLYAATTKGVSVIDVAKLKNKNFSLPVDFTSITLNDIPIDVTKSLIIPPGKFSLHFYQTAISFNDPDSVMFRRRLVGSQEEWAVTRNREAIFTNLPPGKYRYEVLAKTEFGSWNSVPEVFAFTVLPAFYQTAEFKIVVIAIGVCFLILLFYWRLQVIKKREERKTAVNKKIAETELKALRSQMNPHFTFNVLNSIQYYIGTKDTAAAQQYITKFSRLVRMILDQSREQYITLDHKLKFLHLYLELEKMRFENKFSYSITVDEGIEPLEIKMPGLLIQPLVENAIKHGIEHKKGGAVIDIAFHQHNSTLVCTVSDNGIGRAEAAKLKSSNHSYRSVATQILKERIESLESLHGLKLHYHIDDKVDGNETGTIVTIEIPINKPEEVEV